MMSTAQQQAMEQAIQRADNTWQAAHDAGLYRTTPTVVRGGTFHKEAHHKPPITRLG